jgi:curved DNA-binding protein CbpA
MPDDPFLILGLDPDGEVPIDDAAVEAAYRAGIKRCPPERDPAGFQALRAAYERLRTRRERLEAALFDPIPPGSDDILARAALRGFGVDDEQSSAESGGTADSPRKARPSAELLQALLRGEP